MHDGTFRRIARITTNIAHLGAGQFADLPFDLPPLAEQKAILERSGELLELAESGCAEIEQQCQDAQRLRQSILSTAFSGKLVPQDPNDDPASELLARLRGTRRLRPRPKYHARPARTHAADSRWPPRMTNPGSPRRQGLELRACAARPGRRLRRLRRADHLPAVPQDGRGARTPDLARRPIPPEWRWASAHQGLAATRSNCSYRHTLEALATQAGPASARSSGRRRTRSRTRPSSSAWSALIDERDLDRPACRCEGRRSTRACWSVTRRR